MSVAPARASATGLLARLLLGPVRKRCWRHWPPLRPWGYAGLHSRQRCALRVVEIGMYGRGVEPGERLVAQIEIDEGGEAERQIRSRKLRAG